MHSGLPPGIKRNFLYKSWYKKIRDRRFSHLAQDNVYVIISVWTQSAGRLASIKGLPIFDDDYSTSTSLLDYLYYWLDNKITINNFTNKLPTSKTMPLFTAPTSYTLPILYKISNNKCLIKPKSWLWITK